MYHFKKKCEKLYREPPHPSLSVPITMAIQLIMIRDRLLLLRPGHPAVIYRV